MTRYLTDKNVFEAAAGDQGADAAEHDSQAGKIGESAEGAGHSERGVSQGNAASRSQSIEREHPQGSNPPLHKEF